MQPGDWMRLHYKFEEDSNMTNYWFGHWDGEQFIHAETKAFTTLSEAKVYAHKMGYDRLKSLKTCG